MPGEDWEVEIPKALFASDVILVCLSKNSVNKEGFVQKEITFALDKAMEKPEGTIFIIPVKLEDCEIPRRLTRYQWVDLSRAEGRKRLLMGLNKRVTELGPDVSPVILDDTRKTTAPKISKPETKKPEEQIVSVPVKEEAKEEPKKEIQAKPFTKFLNPSSLSPNEKSTLDPNVGRVSNPTESLAPKKRQARSLTYGFWGIALLVLIFGGFGLNYLINNLPISIATVSFPKGTITVFTNTPQLIKNITPTPTLGIGSTMIGEKGETLVYVPAGEFTMGSYNGEPDEKPVHTVYLDAFWIDQTEVTNKQYQACVDAGTCEPPSSTSSYTHPSYYENPEFDNYPVIHVNWDKANRYCEVWIGGDLPTEAQWEKAARGTDQRTYPWGEGINCDKANYNGGCVGDTSPVGNYESGKSPFNAYDMAGNVGELINDYYQSDYYTLLGGNASNPFGPDSGQYRVLRGGSWFYVDSNARSADRYGYDPSYTYSFIGFRCSRSP